MFIAIRNGVTFIDSCLRLKNVIQSIDYQIKVEIEENPDKYNDEESLYNLYLEYKIHNVNNYVDCDKTIYGKKILYSFETKDDTHYILRDDQNDIVYPILAN